MRMGEVWLIGTILEAIPRIIEAITIAVKEQRAINRLRKYERQRKKGNKNGHGIKPTDESKNGDTRDD